MPRRYRTYSAGAFLPSRVKGKRLPSTGQLRDSWQRQTFTSLALPTRSEPHLRRDCLSRFLSGAYLLACTTFPITWDTRGMRAGSTCFAPIVRRLYVLSYHSRSSASQSLLSIFVQKRNAIMPSSKRPAADSNDPSISPSPVKRKSQSNVTSTPTIINPSPASTATLLTPGCRERSRQLLHSNLPEDQGRDPCYLVRTSRRRRHSGHATGRAI